MHYTIFPFLELCQKLQKLSWTEMFDMWGKFILVMGWVQLLVLEQGTRYPKYWRVPGIILQLVEPDL